MVDSSGATEYHYDVRNRLIQKLKTWAAVGLSVALNYAYDASGNLTNIASSSPNGVEVAYEYDVINRLNAVNDAKVGRTSYTYDEVGNLKGYTYPNSVHTEYSYNSLNRLTNLAGSRLLTAIANYAYAVGPTGNRTNATEALFASALNSHPSTINRIYHYDDIYRLIGETINGVPAVGYGYDPVGNRLSRTSVLPELPAQNFGYDSNDRLNTDTYDSNGNTLVGRLPSVGVVQDTYDFENRLTTRLSPLATIHLVYDGDGNRVKKTVTTATNMVTTLYLVDDQNPTGYAQVLEESEIANLQSQILTKVYTYGHALISQDRLDGAQWTTSFYGYDGHNNVRYLTDDLGQVTDTYDYDAFGNLIGRVGTTPNHYLFTGEQYDPDLGLYYLRARYHNPDTGRFWTQDTFEGFGSDPSSLHKYTYCGNNPVNAWDPSGNVTLNEVVFGTGIRARITMGLFSALGAGGYSAYSSLRHGGSVQEAVINGGAGVIIGLGLGYSLGPLPAVALISPAGQMFLQQMQQVAITLAAHDMSEGYPDLAAIQIVGAFAPNALTYRQLVIVQEAEYGTMAADEAAIAARQLAVERSYSGGLIQVAKPDPAAEELAAKLGGVARVRFANDTITQREFDAISPEYIGQAKSAPQSIGESFRNQAKATFEAAKATKRKVYYRFEGEPGPDVIRALRRYEARYGVKLEIEIAPKDNP